MNLVALDGSVKASQFVDLEDIGEYNGRHSSDILLAGHNGDNIASVKTIVAMRDGYYIVSMRCELRSGLGYVQYEYICSTISEAEEYYNALYTKIFSMVFGKINNGSLRENNSDIVIRLFKPLDKIVKRCDMEITSMVPYTVAV